MLFVAHASVLAQSVSDRPSARALSEALTDLGRRTGTRVVFARQMVEGKISSCMYDSMEAGPALQCLLRGTGLTARLVRRGQWVIGPESYTERVRESARPKVQETYRVSGLVVDAETGESLAGAHVYLEDRTNGTVTDAEGSFSLQGLKESTVQVKVSFLSYSPESFTLVAGAFRRIGLSPATFETGEVIVEDHRAEVTESRVTVGAVALSEKDFASLPSFQGTNDLFQVLQNVPSVRRTSEANGELVIRGSEDGQNLYLLDGVPVYSPSRTFGQFSSYQTDLIRDVRLYRGSMPAEFGGRLSSVLDATLKDGQGDRTSITAGIGSRNVRLMVESPLGQYLSGMVALRSSHSADERLNILAGDGDVQLLDAGYRFNDITAKLTFRPEPGHQLSGTLYRGGDSLDTSMNGLLFPTLLGDPRYSAGRIQSGIGHSWINERYSLAYRYIQGADFMVDVLAYHTGYTMREQNEALADPDEGFLSTYDYRILGDYAARLRDRGVTAEMNHFLSSRFQTRAGLQVIHHTFESSLEKIETDPLVTEAQIELRSSVRAIESVIYIENNWQPFDNLEIQPGVRLGSFESYRYISPRLQARLQALPNLAIRAGVSSQVQHVHWLRDRFAIVYEPGLDVWQSSGIMHIRPARGLQVAGGVETTPASWVTVAVDVYWRRFKNVLLAENPYRLRDGLDEPWIEADLNPQRYVPGNSKAYGLELSVELGSRNWRSNLAYSLSRSLYQRPELRSFLPARFDAPHAFRGSVTHTRTGWTYALIGEIRSGYPTQSRYVFQQLAAEKVDGKSASNSFLAYSPTTPSERLPFYARLDASVGYRFSLLGLHWDAEVELFNLTNRRNFVDQVYLIGNSGANSLEGRGFMSQFNIKLTW